MAATIAPPADEFVGREHELRAVDAAFEQGAWLVTIVGTGGIGKTRLALEIASRRNRRPETGADTLLVALDQVRSLDALIAEVVAALGVSLSSDRTGVEQVGHALAGRGDVLLVLDNLEQIVDEAAAVLSAWRRLAPDTRVLATSRQPIGLAGERRVKLPPLTPEESSDLFVSRARAIDYGFRIRPDQRGHLLRLVDRLEGIPLAIELAAARVDLLTLESLCERLGDSLSLLRSTRRDVATRQATLTATIDWSWQLLSADERRTLARCGVFRGGFSLEAAEAVVPAGDGPSAVVDVLQALCDKSLIRCERDGGAARYRLYESIRAFANDRLGEWGEDDACAARHAAYYEQIARPLMEVGALYGTCGLPALVRAGAELDNLFAAMQRTARTSPQTSAWIGLALANLLHLRGPRSRCLRTVEAAFEAAGRAGDDELRCRLLLVRAASRRQWGGSDPDPDLVGARGLALELGDRELEACALYHLGMISLERGGRVRAQTLLREALSIQEAIGDALGMGLTREGLAVLYTWSGDYAVAQELHDRAIDASRSAGNRRWEAISLRNRAFVHHQCGDPQRALRDSQHALAIHTELRDPHGMVTLVNCIEMAAQVGDLALACAYADMALPRARNGESTPRLGDPFLPRAYVHVLEGQLRAAEDLLDEGLDWHQPFDDPRLRASALVGRGVVRMLRGRTDAARMDLEDALALSRCVDQIVTDACLAAGFLAALEATTGRPGRAWPLWAYALQQARRWGLRRFERTLRALEPCFGADSPEPAPVTRHPFLEEAAARLFVQRVAADGTPRSDVVVVGPGVAWIEPPHRARIDLRRRPVLHRLLVALVEARRTRPGQPIPTKELLAHGWPGDRSDPSALENRLWVALSSARKLGLDEILLKEPDGYLLDPVLELRREAVRRAG